MDEPPDTHDPGAWAWLGQALIGGLCVWLLVALFALLFSGVATIPVVLLGRGVLKGASKGLARATNRAGCGAVLAGVLLWVVLAGALGLGLAAAALALLAATAPRD